MSDILENLLITLVISLNVSWVLLLLLRLTEIVMIDWQSWFILTLNSVLMYAAFDYWKARQFR